METKGIKESLELLEGLRLLGVDAKLVLADGKIDLKDITVGWALVGQLSKLNAAAQGISEVPSELKDLSADEVHQLATAALAIVTSFKA